MAKVKGPKTGGGSGKSKSLSGGNQVCPPGVFCLENSLIIIILLLILIIIGIMIYFKYQETSRLQSKSNSNSEMNNSDMDNNQSRNENKNETNSVEIRNDYVYSYPRNDSLYIVQDPLLNRPFYSDWWFNPWRTNRYYDRTDRYYNNTNTVHHHYKTNAPEPPKHIKPKPPRDNSQPLPRPSRPPQPPQPPQQPQPQPHPPSSLPQQPQPPPPSHQSNISLQNVSTPQQSNPLPMEQIEIPKVEPVIQQSIEQPNISVE
jgi:hypothetical protein